MALTATQIQEQKQQAEELLFSGPTDVGFAKGLFFGRFQAPLLFPYPELKPDDKAAVDKAVARGPASSRRSTSTPPPSIAMPTSRGASSTASASSASWA